ncbi:hypothetical protein BT69DRAFT_726318 [Atractiella rhizophila]|nr:hypothetical protein BT69DRAFT_726318 [Atractiella rhizophila]
MIGEIIRNQAPYSGEIAITWTYTSSRISVSGSSKWNKVFTLPIPIRVILTILLVYPIMLLLRLFFGSRYTTVRIGFPIRQWRFIKGSENVTSGEEALALLRNSWERGAEEGARLVRPAGNFPEGWFWEEGMGEEEWAERWQWGIIDAVRRNRQGGLLKSGGSRISSAQPSPARLA